MIKIIKKKINMSDELKAKINWSCKFNNRAIGTKIEYLKLQNTTLKKYVPSKNDKDNAN